MKIRGDHTKLGRQSLAISVWDDEGGPPASDAQAFDTADHHYGRRIEADRSWTIYHVFTGAPVRVDGRMMTGLDRQDATDGMLSLNRLNEQRSKDRRALSPPSSAAEAVRRP